MIKTEKATKQKRKISLKGKSAKAVALKRPKKKALAKGKDKKIVHLEKRILELESFKKNVQSKIRILAGYKNSKPKNEKVIKLENRIIQLETIRKRIETKVKIPPDYHGSRIYPFPVMKVGHSFSLEYNRGMQISLYRTLKHFLAQKPNWKFKIKSSKKFNYIRCWRIK